MSLIKKADVNNYLSARRKKNVLPFRSTSQADATGYSESSHGSAKVNRQAPSAGSGGAVVPATIEKP